MLITILPFPYYETISRTNSFIFKIISFVLKKKFLRSSVFIQLQIKQGKFRDKVNDLNAMGNAYLPFS